MHKTISTSGLRASTVCENEGCNEGRLIKYFCKTCKLQICEKCKEVPILEYDKQRNSVFTQRLFYHNSVTAYNACLIAVYV